MQSLGDYPDLIVDQCPIDCENCGEIYVNDQIGHRIVCRCIRCNHNKKEKLTLAEVGAPETNVAKSMQPFSKEASLRE
jgi:hypothetical protein